MENPNKRTIVHMDLDSFFVSVERLKNPSLIGKPVLIGGNSERSVVSSCSYEARKFGVHSAMPMKVAKNLCPAAVIVGSGMGEYTRYSKMVTAIIEESAPLYQKASIDEHYIDITGMDRFFGCFKWTQELRQRIIKESGLPISFGQSINKTIAKMATNEAKPNGELEVREEDIAGFLGPMPVQKIPMIGQSATRQLNSMGIETIKDLREYPLDELKERMGKHGILAWKRANGVDNSPVHSVHNRKSISSESTFDKDTGDISFLMDILVKKTERVAYTLRKQEMLTSCITVKIRYSGFETESIQKQIPYTSFDHEIIPVVKTLFKGLYNKRKMVRLIGVRLSSLIKGFQQIDMFENNFDMMSLYQAVDGIRNKFGKSAVQRAAGLDIYPKGKPGSEIKP